MKNFPKTLWSKLQNFKESPAIYTAGDDGRDEVSFWEWTRRIQNVAMAMLDAGFEAGTRVGFVASNCRDWLDVAVATWLVGGCVVPLNPNRDRDYLLHCLGRSGCDWIAIDDEHTRSRLRGPGGQLPSHLNWIVFEAEESRDQVYAVEQMAKDGRHLVQRGHNKKIAERIYGLDGDAPTLVLFEPDPEDVDDVEGAFFGGRKVAWQLASIADQAGFGESEEPVVGSVLSFGWFSAFLLSMAALYDGRAVALSSSDAELQQQFKRLRPTHLICGPDYLQKLADDWKDRFESAPDILDRLSDSDESDPSALDRALGAIGGRVAERILYGPIREQFGGQLQVIQVFEGRCPVGLHPMLDGADIKLLGHYGVPEAGITHVEHPGARRTNSAGRPIEGVATKIADAKSGEVGELCIRSEMVFDDYWAGEGRRTIEDGWLRTGRRARLESGYLFLER